MAASSALGKCDHQCVCIDLFASFAGKAPYPLCIPSEASPFLLYQALATDFNLQGPASQASVKAV